MSNTFDFLVIGGGVAGASAAYWLSHRGRVCVLEQESQPGYHSTSRSAAILSEAYGPRTWQILNSVTRGFFTAPPEGFAEQPVAKPLGALFLGRPQEEAAVRDQHAELTRRRVRSSLVTPDEARRLSPAVRMEPFTIGLYEPDCVSLDAAAILQGFLKLARRNGAEVRLKAPVERLAYRDGTWHVTAGGQSIETAVVVNAAGAWVDDVAALAGLSRRGVTPFRRTAITIDPPAGQNALAWPMTFDMAETWYFKPEGRHIMISPADLIEVEPGDAQPEEIDVAIAVDRIETATTLKVDRIVSRWAGLRTLAPDHEAVIGPDPENPAFVWYAGQGGNGVMASAAGGEVVAALAAGDAIPEPIAALGLTPGAISPGRLKASDRDRVEG